MLYNLKLFLACMMKAQVRGQNTPTALFYRILEELENPLSHGHLRNHSNPDWELKRTQSLQENGGQTINKGEEIIIFDEFNSSYPLQNFELLIDSCPHSVAIKGSNKPFRGKLVIICSNYNPDNWYPKDSAKEAITRRRSPPCGRTIHIQDCKVCDELYQEFKLKRPNFEQNNTKWGIPLSIWTNGDTRPIEMYATEQV